MTIESISIRSVHATVGTCPLRWHGCGWKQCQVVQIPLKAQAHPLTVLL